MFYFGARSKTDIIAPFCLVVQAEKMMLAVEDCVQFKEEVKTTLDDLIQGQKEVQDEFVKILDSPTVRDAQQLLLIYQVP